MYDPNKNKGEEDAHDAVPEHDNTGVYALECAIQDTVGRVDPWTNENEGVAQN